MRKEKSSTNLIYEDGKHPILNKDIKKILNSKETVNIDTESIKKTEKKITRRNQTEKVKKEPAKVSLNKKQTKIEPKKQNNTAQKNSIFEKGKLKIIPLGGLQEVGKNITVFEYGSDIVIVDCGVGFPEEIELDKNKKHNISVIIDRLVIKV